MRTGATPPAPKVTGFPPYTVVSVPNAARPGADNITRPPSMAVLALAMKVASTSALDCG